MSHKSWKSVQKVAGQMDDAEKFRILRNAWFNMVLRFKPPEREWETGEEEVERENRNDRMKQVYDRQTEEILRGADLPITPRCWDDLRERV